MARAVSEDGEMQYPKGFCMEDVIGLGTTGLVVHDKTNMTIVKTAFIPEDSDANDRISKEMRIYERFITLGYSPHLLSYHGPYESGFRLEYATNGPMRRFIPSHPETGIEQRLRWCIQTTEALNFIHNAGVIHGDLTCANILVDGNMEAKVADFAGSSLDGSPLQVVITESHEYPGDLLSIQADLFALGCVFYELMSGHPPYHDLENQQITMLYEEGKFPDTSSLHPLGEIIRNCWLGKYDNCDAVALDLKEQQRISTLPAFTLFSSLSLQTTIAVVAAIAVTALILVRHKSSA